ncbi:MAG: hypothetical protein J5819_01525 [Eubacterium sp.]|nr:hypothetical protein [Eubacterium sp.]
MFIVIRFDLVAGHTAMTLAGLRTDSGEQDLNHRIPIILPKWLIEIPYTAT